MTKELISSSKAAPIVWSSSIEHIIKASIYTVLVGHAFKSALHSTTIISYIINPLLAMFGLWMATGEILFAIQRIQRKLPPGYLGFPILREIRFLLTANNGGIIDSINTARRNYGTLFSQNLFGRTNIVVGGQDDITWLFNNDRKATTEIAWPPNIVALLGPGAVANQSGKYHRVLRRLLEPYFAPTFVTNYLAIMDQTTLEELDNWSSSGEFISSEIFKMYALRLFYASSFGRVDDHCVKSLHDDFKTWIGGFMSVTGDKQIPGTAFAEAMKARDRILDTVDTLIDEFTRENPEESERAQTTIVGRLIYGKDKDDNRMMTRDEMKDNILNLIFAGHDTTYASISTLLYHLSQNPDAMEAATKEVADLSEPLNADELRNAPVLNACIHESWRKDPPVGGSFRKAVKGIQYKGFSYQPGTVFNYSILMATTDETLYKEYDKFQFGRFLPKDHPLYWGGGASSCREEKDKQQEIDPFQGRAAYPIFGGGTHVCLGKSFAQLELRVLAARVLKHYKVEVRNPHKVFFPVNLWNIEFKLTKKKDM